MTQAKTEKATEPEVWEVTDRDGRRVFYSGPEDGAYAYVEANFPRIHVEPNTNYGADGPEADAYVRSPSGTFSSFDGNDWTEYKE